MAPKPHTQPARQPSGRQRKQTEKENYRTTLEQETAERLARAAKKAQDRDEHRRHAAEESDDDENHNVSNDKGDQSDDDGCNHCAHSEDNDDEDEVMSHAFSSRVVISKPATIKKLVPTTRKVPATPGILTSKKVDTPCERRSHGLSERRVNGDSRTNKMATAVGVTLQGPNCYNSGPSHSTLHARPIAPLPVRASHQHSRSHSTSCGPELDQDHNMEGMYYAPECGDNEGRSDSSLMFLDDAMSSSEYVTGNKRARSPDDDHMEIVHAVQTAKAQKVHESQGRPKAKDYDDITQEILSTAISVYRSRISTDTAFPNHAVEVQFGKYAWKEACEKSEVVMDMTPEILKMITSRGSHLRGELKTKVRPLVEAIYGFDSGHNKKTIKHNRQLAEDLKEAYGFIYKELSSDPTERKGLYQNPILQKVINAMWFANKHDEGVVYHRYFKPFPIPALALVLTIECAIDKWSTGIKMDLAFTAADYHSVYDAHLTCLKSFSAHGKAKGIDLLDKICIKLHNIGRFHSGAQPIAPVIVPALNPTIFAAALQEYEDDTATEDDGEEGDEN